MSPKSYQNERQRSTQSVPKIVPNPKKLVPGRKNKDFGGKFTELARSVYFTNDKRSEVKKLINILTGSDLVEEKSYEDYK